MAVKRVTKAVVDRLGVSGVVWDADVRGFGVRRQQRDPSYILKVRVGTRQRFLTIGRHGAPWTPQTARKEARRLLGQIASGRDPADVRAALRGAPNFREFADRYLSEHVLVSKKPRSAVEDRRNLERHILPTLGRRLVLEISSADVAKLHASKSGTPIAANRCLSSCRICSIWRSVGGCAAVGRTRASTSPNILNALGNECSRQRNWLNSARRSLRQLPAIPTTSISDARYYRESRRRLARASPRQTSHLHRRASLKILGLRWDQLNLQRGIARLGESKTGAKNIYLTEPALEVLRAIPTIR